MSEAQRTELLASLRERGFAEAIFSVYEWLLGSLQRAWPVDAEPGEVDLFSTVKPVSATSELLTLHHSVRAGSFDVRQKTDGLHARELRSLLGTGALLRSGLAASSKGFVALAEADKLNILDTTAALALEPKPSSGATTSAAASGASAAAAAAAAAERSASGAGGSGAAADRAGLRSVCKTSLGFEAVSVAFNPQDEQQLLVSGLKDCVVLTLGARGEVVSRLVVDLLLDSLGLNTPVHLIKSGWLPNSASQCFVLTNQFLKIYDLARDKISPIHYFQTLDDAIKDVAFVHAERLLPPPGSSGAAGGGKPRSARHLGGRHHLHAGTPRVRLDEWAAHSDGRAAGLARFTRPRRRAPPLLGAVQPPLHRLCGRPLLRPAPQRQCRGRPRRLCGARHAHRLALLERRIERLQIGVHPVLSLAGRARPARHAHRVLPQDAHTARPPGHNQRHRSAGAEAARQSGGRLRRLEPPPRRWLDRRPRRLLGAP